MAVGAAWAAVELGLGVYDAYDTGRTLADPSASTGDKLLAGGLFAAGLVGPGGGYGTAGKSGKKALSAGEAGRFADLRARAIPGDGLTPHHMPQTAAGFTSRAAGGALVMPEAAHALTRTFNGRGRIVAQAEAGLPFRQVLARDIRDVRRIAGGQYNGGVRDLLDYYRTSFPHLMQK